MLKAVKKTRVHEEILAQLSRLIQEGALKPGDRLPTERALATEFRVSRASVREALRSLEVQGLVSTRQGSGTYISELDQDELLRTVSRLAGEEQTLRDIFELRLLLEPPIAALAAHRATPEDLGKLEAALRDQEAQIRLGLSGSDADVSFHSALAEATHNNALLRLGSTLIEVLAPSRDMRLQTPRRSQLSLHSHTQVLDAVKASSAESAHKAMQEHIGQLDRVSFGLRKEEFPLLTQLNRGPDQFTEVDHD